MGDAGSLLTIGTAIVQGVQGRREAKAQLAEGKYQEQVYNSNARMSQMQADDATRRGEEKALEIRQQGKKLIGKQRAAMAAQGLDLEQDDPLNIQMESAAYTAEDSRQTKANAWQEAWGYRVQAQDYANKAKFANITGKQKSRGTILTTGLNIMNTFASKQTPRYGG